MLSDLCLVHRLDPLTAHGSILKKAEPAEDQVGPPLGQFHLGFSHAV